MTRRPTPPDVLTLREFSALIGVNEKTLRLCIERGDAPGYKLGSRIVIPKPAVERFMNGEWTPEYRPHLIVVKEGASA